MFLLLVLLSTSACVITVQARPQATDLSRLPPGDPEAQVEEDIASLAALAASLSEEQATSDATSVGTESTAGDAEATEAPEVAATEVVPSVPAGDGEQGSPAAPAEEAAEEVGDESSTIAPTITEPPPEPELPTDESEPTVAEHEPTVAESEPTAAESEPTVAEAEPTVVEPEPTVAEPEPTVAEPEPTVAEAEPTVAEPKLTVAESEAEPTVAEPEPTVAEPEPTVAEPEPTVAESEPTESPQPEEPEETSAVEELVTEAAPADKEDAEVPVTSPTEGPASEGVTPTVPQPLPGGAVSEPSVQLSPDAADDAQPEDEAAEEIASSAAQDPSGEPAEAVKQQETEDIRLPVLRLPTIATPMHVRPEAAPAGMDVSGTAFGDDVATMAPAMDVDPTMQPKKMDADAGTAAPKGEEQVDLDDVYKQGVESHVGQSDVLTNMVEESMGSLFLDSRQVAYKLGRHKVSTYVTELKVTGIEDMRILEVSSDIEDMSLNVTFQFPEIRFSGKFNATGSIMDKEQRGLLVLRTPFPSYGHGNIQAVIANTTAISQAELSHSFNDRKLSIELLTCHLTFGEPEVTLTDVKLPRALRKLHFERLFRVALAKMISHQLTAEVEPKVDESLHDVITTVLDRVSLDEDGARDFVSLGASPDAWKGAVRS